MFMSNWSCVADQCEHWYRAGWHLHEAVAGLGEIRRTRAECIKMSENGDWYVVCLNTPLFKYAGRLVVSFRMHHFVAIGIFRILMFRQLYIISLCSTSGDGSGMSDKYIRIVVQDTQGIFVDWLITWDRLIMVTLPVDQGGSGWHVALNSQAPCAK